jgi:carbonic anhydrase
MLQTTPGCNEGVRWHVFREPLTITLEDMARFQKALAATTAAGDPAVERGSRSNSRYLQPLNGRTIYYDSSPETRTSALRSRLWRRNDEGM